MQHKRVMKQASKTRILDYNSQAKPCIFPAIRRKRLNLFTAYVARQCPNTHTLTDGTLSLQVDIARPSAANNTRANDGRMKCWNPNAQKLHRRNPKEKIKGE